MSPAWSTTASSTSTHLGMSIPTMPQQNLQDRSLSWRSCGTRLECASLDVPKDYANLSRGFFTLAIVRVPARGVRQGSLLINPGGPGVAGLGFAPFVASALPASVNAMYDIVAFDPRGTGESAPVTCLNGKGTTRWLRTDPTPDTRAEQIDYMKEAARIGAGCLQRSPRIAPFVDSQATVRDMESIRQALGENTLNFLGFSYGTYLGALYAEEFPDRVGRIVLDGAVDPRLDAMQISRDQSTGFQRAMRAFAEDCATQTTCPYSGGAPRVLAGINQLLKGLDQKPMRAGGPVPLNEAQAMTALFSSMYTPDRWSPLRRALAAARQGNGQALQSMAQGASDQTGPNTYATNMASSFYAISCLDVPKTPGAFELARLATKWSRGASIPAMAEAMSWGNAPCTSWFAHGAKRGAVSTSTNAPIMIVGTTGDPATPYEWAQSLSQQLPTSRLLTYRGNGHTAVANNNNCIDSSVAEYLTTGVLPAVGKVCS